MVVATSKGVDSPLMLSMIATVPVLVIYLVLVSTTGLYHIAVYASPAPALLALLAGSSIFEKFEEQNRRLMVENLLRTGKGLSSRGLRASRFFFQLSIALTLLFTSHAVTCTLVSHPRVEFIILALIATTTSLFLYFMPRILVGLWASQRKTDIEVELPYLLILFRVMASLKLPLYDMFTVIEGSTALPASAREVRFARKVATLTSVSFLSAMDMVCTNHPSEKIRELFRRVVLAAISMSDVRNVVERVFDSVYSWFESKVAGLSEKFTIIVGSALFAYLFIPVIVAALVPVIGGNLLAVLGLTLSMQCFLFFLLYALITSFYPSSLVMRPPGTLLAVSAVSLGASFALLIYAMFSHVAEAPVQLPRLSEYTLSLIVLGLLTPPLIVAERALRRVGLYDAFVRMASDAVSLAATTGENIALVLERSSRKYSRGVVRLTRSILAGYLSEPLKKAIISRAPSTYHASFIETLVVMLRLGSTPDMMRAFSSSYERLNVLFSRVKSLARTLEVLMVGLSAVIGGFLAFIDKVYEYIAGLIRVAGPLGASTIVFAYDPRIYGLLSTLSLLSLLFTSLFVGKVRGGSVVYCYRALVSMLVLYTVSKYLLTITPF